MSKQDHEKLIHAFISSRLDYCNGLLTGLSKGAVRKLQLVQNAAARVLTKTKKLNILHLFSDLYTGYQSVRGLNSKYY